MGMAVAMITVERTLLRNIQTTRAVSSVPSSRCSSRESTISRTNRESSEETDSFIPGGSCGLISESMRR
jgi:hypothetical protein